MSRLFVPFCLLLFTVSVWSETCTLHGTFSDWKVECNHERCHHIRGFTIGCVAEPDSAPGKGVCTCITRCDDDVDPCRVKNDCIRNALLNKCGQCLHGDHDYHCIDNHCHCGFPTSP